MKVIVSDSFPDTTNLALIAMVDILAWRIVVKLALGTKISSKLPLTFFVHTTTRYGLLRQAEHAHHFLGVKAHNRMVHTGMVVA